MNTADRPAIQLYNDPDPQREAVLRVILSLPGEGPADAQARVDRLVEYIERQSLHLGVVLGAKMGGRLVSGVMLIESPGRLGAAFIPAGSACDGRRHATSLLLDRLPQHAWDHALVLIQALVDQQARSEADLYAQAGFGHLAELIYLERPAQAPTPDIPALDGVDFATYSQPRHALFLNVLEQTYQESQDCPKLSGIRLPAEVLATHRATGVFDPQGWFLVTRNAQPVGILLLAGTQAGRALSGSVLPAFEVVYMGVIPQARATGIGDAIMARAVDYCRRHGQADLNLAVDQQNEPARRLYRRWGMLETTRRSAWFIPNPQRTG